jgi:hypothetical protein
MVLIQSSKGNASISSHCKIKTDKDDQAFFQLHFANQNGDLYIEK